MLSNFPGQMTSQNRARNLLIACFAFLLLAGGAVAFIAQRTSAAESWLAHTLEVQKSARELLGLVQDAEIGQRSYLLTDDREYLAPYDLAVATTPVAFEQLLRLTADNPEQQDRLRRIKPLIDSRFAVSRNVIELASQGKKSEALSVVLSGKGKSLITAIRKQFDILIDAESTLLTQRGERASYLRLVLFSLIGLCLLIVCVLAALVASSFNRYIQSLKNEASQRAAMEQTLRQSQKMEAVGQLTGGVAHDFNNLLQIILGNLEIALRKITNAEGVAQPFAHSIEKHVASAIQGGKSAAQLTHRLLAFSRQQPLAPKVVDLNKLVGGMSDLLRRSVTEEIDVEFVASAGTWRANVDVNQLENAILNLVINARDAMPEGGKITIETGNAYLDDSYAARFGDIKAGQYALLTVADTGGGIPAELMDKVFEPFFTTKAVGSGSGLGLAMVHGFVKQSGGHIRVYSEPGEGTSIKLYFPRSIEAPIASGPVETAAAAVELPRAKSGETVLVVEDNEGVRLYATAVLEDLGYRVSAAGDAAEGLKLIDGVDLLFTDVILPGGKNGRVLAEEVAKLRPELPVLFTTGYTRNAIVHHGRLDANVMLLSKPYSQLDLARKIREALDGGVSGQNVVQLRG